MTVTNTGLNDIANSMVSGTASQFENIAVGTGATSFSITQTALGTETNRQASTDTDQSTIGQTLKSTTFAIGTIVNKSLAEAGVFSATTGGDMFNRVQYNPTFIDGTTTTRIDFIFTWKR